VPLFHRQPSYTLVFLHLPKTGGITLREILLRRIGHRPVLRMDEPDLHAQWLRAQPEAWRARLALVHGHIYYGVHELLPRPCLYMTMLRDPLERVLSYYSFIREAADHHLHAQVREGNLNLAGCIRRGLTVELDNFQVRALTSLRNIHVPFGGVTREMLTEAKAHLDGMSLVGVTEQFDASLAHFCRALRWPRVAAPVANRTVARVQARDLDPADLALVREQNRLDAELHAHATRLLHARLDQAAPFLTAASDAGSSPPSP